MITMLSVTVAVDPDLTSITIRAAGLLSADNVRGLLGGVDRAERTFPHFLVRVDPEHLRPRSPEALHFLQRSAAVQTAETVAVNSPSRAG